MHSNWTNTTHIFLLPGVICDDDEPVNETLVNFFGNMLTFCFAPLFQHPVEILVGKGGVFGHTLCFHLASFHLQLTVVYCNVQFANA